MLIVPYGIETCKEITSIPLRSVLIVPYGIETENQIPEQEKIHVLIVPYGIETQQHDLQNENDNRVNCTLWN